MLLDLLRGEGGELRGGHGPGHHGGEHLDLAQVRVAALLVVLDDGDLQEEGAHQLVVDVLQGDLHPARGLLQLHHLNLLQVVEVGSHSKKRICILN